MKREQFKNKRYLVNDTGNRVAHVHTFGDSFKVCGHISSPEFAKQKYEFNEKEFNQFLSDKNLVMEG
ncbi:hypothetical protein [Staphylococcus sp. LKG3-3]|uniref:hypothetical protein n=1 Tax=Staphylococcus sp. LKG3-3 TaxID=3399685 RepID=UPI003D4B5848